MTMHEHREKWIQTLYNLRLQTITAVLLEALGPVNILGAQLVYLSQPILSIFVSPDKSRDFAKILEDPTETALFVEALRTYEPAA